ncbi:MAG TPA: hypothetical protein ENK06_03810 [Gammaproteobacteria bacterium]|nr:hypothetical protein [Gammaproteobacteria bacterium]
MKTAVSIPNPTFEAAETLASRLGMSRSELYARAINDYINSHKYQDVTKILNQVYGEQLESIEDEFHTMQMDSLPKDDWQ